MRFAIFSDIHANRAAFEAVLADATSRGFDRAVILGDIVGYGPDPGWCTEKVAELVAGGAIAVQGNHDAAAGGTDAPMHGAAWQAILWTRGVLTPAQTAFLRDLPLEVSMGEVLFVHASPDDPGAWKYVTSHTRAVPAFGACTARVILCGHVHVPMLSSRDRAGMVREQAFPIGLPLPLIRSRRWLAVVGSVGQPRDGSPQAGYAILDTEADQLTLLRAPYDVGRTVQGVRAAGLPESLALRLLRGE